MVKESMELLAQESVEVLELTRVETQERLLEMPEQTRRCGPVSEETGS